MLCTAMTLSLVVFSTCFSQTPQPIKEAGVIPFPAENFSFCLHESPCDSTCFDRPHNPSNADSHRSKGTPFFYPNFSNNPAISPHMRELMSPHLLPLNHYMKPILDSIFSRSRATETRESLVQAGFTIIFAQEKSLIIVAKHPQVPGYLFKIFPDSINVHNDGKAGWELFTTRCVVAKKIRKIIKKKKLRHFTVAHKWIYPLPINPKSHYAQQEPVILLVKDMRIYSKHRSKHMWKTRTTKSTLRQLYAVLGHGYGSAFLSNNVPYTKRGKCAFIDTEYDKRKISLWLVNHFLSKKMQHHWNKILKKHQPSPQEALTKTPSPGVERKMKMASPQDVQP